MTVRETLRAACVDFYHQSWRLFLLNAALSTFVLPLLVAGAFAPPLLVLLVLAGPLAAALMHCAVQVAQTEELRLADAVVGLRLHWRRGLALAAVLGAAVLGAATAIPFYTRGGPLAWPLTMVALYLFVLVAVLQLPLWTLAVAERERPLGDVTREAVAAIVRQPGRWAAFALALTLVNLAGAAAALAPLLTVTIAYSFLAAAHFALPRSPLREAAGG
jgi:hypothetical protein